MNKEKLETYFPEPLMVGEKDAVVPVWPIFKHDMTDTKLIAYVFESVDMAPIPGFSGVPVNLLVALDPKGQFLEVRVISQHEPVFVDGLGPEPLYRFVEQYKGLSLKQPIRISSSYGKKKVDSANVVIDGVTKATASVLIINQSLLSAALKVARAKLGYANGPDPDLVARARPRVYEQIDVSALEKKKLAQRLTLSNADIDQAFAGSGMGKLAGDTEKTPYVDIYLTPVSIPSVGRNVLAAHDWQRLSGRLEDGDMALLIISRGQYSFISEDFTRGAVPDRLSLKQNGLSIEMRDLDMDANPHLPPGWESADWKIFRIIGQAGLDVSKPMELSLRVSRSKSTFLGEKIHREFNLNYQLPDTYFDAAQDDQKTWLVIWKSRWWELALLVAGLAILSVALVKQQWLTRNPRRLTWFRNTYLLYTLGFIGWYAQGQLSIVNLTALAQALASGRSLGFFLYDPMTVLLWAYVLVALAVWGRGTFCGWLCPFGALQDLISSLARLARLPALHIHTRWDARLKWIKYALLAVIILLAFYDAKFDAKLADHAVEVEPFKTAITLVFMRNWYFVVWAVGLIFLSAFVYKGYCRYLCPLGAWLALLGQTRRWNWLARRTECGKPCQTCRYKCSYQAIKPTGAIDYTECFQCLDCVQIYQDDKRCLPLIKTPGKNVIKINVQQVRRQS